MDFLILTVRYSINIYMVSTQNIVWKNRIFGLFLEKVYLRHNEKVHVNLK